MIGFGTSPLELLASEAMLQGLVYLDEFVYSVSFNSTTTAIGSLGTGSVQLLINGDSDFVAQEMCVTVFTNTTTINASPNLLLTITRSGSGREIMNQPQHIQNLAGNYWNNAQPGRKPMPGKFEAATNVTFTIQNLRAQAEGRIDVSLIGFKVFYTGGTPMQVWNPAAGRTMYAPR